MNRIPTSELSSDVVWHGHSGDLVRLIESAVAHCNCLPVAGPGDVSRLCGAHEILNDQRTLDHLAFARSVRARLVDDEWRRNLAPAANLGSDDSDDWSALLSPPVPSPSQPRPSVTRSVDNRWSRFVRSPLLLSLIALLFLFCLGAPGEPLMPPDHPIAGRDTR